MKKLPLILIVLITMIAVAAIWLLPTPGTTIEELVRHPDSYKIIIQSRAIQTTQIMIFGAALFWIVGRKLTT